MRAAGQQERPLGADVPAEVEQVPVIAVASGKGGVGKTTAAVNVALPLSAEGARVGLVDADLYGPDAAHMTGLNRTKDASHVTLFAAKGTASARLQAVERYGVQMASAAFLIGQAQGLGVQAPIAQLLVHRLIGGTTWDDIDCLIVDLPPGTADIQQLVFTLGKRATYALVVVTPSARTAARPRPCSPPPRTQSRSGRAYPGSSACRSARRRPMTPTSASRS
jgi:Mrp family chromosome partitioning ATPase